MAAGSMRYVIAIFGLLLLLASIAGLKAAQISTLVGAGRQAQKIGPPPEAVNTATVEEQTWEGTITAVATVAAAKGVAISNEAPGVISRLHFESGATVRRGQLLVELDSDVERAQLASVRARQKLAALSLERSRKLVESGAIAPAQLDADQSAFGSLTADAKSLEAQVDRKQVRAPFAGRLGIRAVNLGQYLAPGTPVTVLESAESLFVDFTLPQQYLGRVSQGTAVRALDAGEKPVAEGTVTALDPAVDAVTRTFKVRADVPKHEGRLHPGMFVRARVVLSERVKVVTIPVTAVLHAAYGDSVFCVENRRGPTDAPLAGPDGKPLLSARQQFVKLGETRGDFVSVLDGLRPGQLVVTAGAFKLHNGGPVIVRHDVDLHPELAPHPANR
jgi:membrane fusion protein (multidrug efflux system)